jgi:hypothetical protein
MYRINKNTDGTSTNKMLATKPKSLTSIILPILVQVRAMPILIIEYHCTKYSLTTLRGNFVSLAKTKSC